MIFFARYEASQFGSPAIETEHLLLGVVHEETEIREELPALEVLKREIAASKGISEVISTSVDLPLSQDSKRVLAYAAEEATRLSHHDIGTKHLLLGLMRVEGSLAQKLLLRHGVTLENLREKTLSSVDKTQPQEPATREALAALITQLPDQSLQAAANMLRHLTQPRLRRGGMTGGIGAGMGGGFTGINPFAGPRTFSSSHLQGPVWTHEHRRTYMGHEFAIIEQFEIREGGKILKYTQKLSGPNKEHEFEFDFDLAEPPVKDPS